MSEAKIVSVMQMLCDDFLDMDSLRQLLEQVLTDVVITPSNAAVAGDTDTAEVYGIEEHIALMRRVSAEVTRSPFNPGDIFVLAGDMVDAGPGSICFEVVRVLYHNWSTEFLSTLQSDEVAGSEDEEVFEMVRKTGRRRLPGHAIDMGSLLDELGRLNAPEGLSHLGAQRTGLDHLGAVHEGLWAATFGYKYSIPIEIKASLAKSGIKTEVKWHKGDSLYARLLEIRPVAAWKELRDDEGVVYYGSPTQDARISELQKHMETNAHSQRRLILTLNSFASIYA
jgi:hypothetical protein